MVSDSFTEIYEQSGALRNPDAFVYIAHRPITRPPHWWYERMTDKTLTITCALFVTLAWVVAVWCVLDAISGP